MESNWHVLYTKHLEAILDGRISAYTPEEWTAALKWEKVLDH